MLESLSHIALVVQDPARTAALFRELFSARVVERKDEEGHLETTREVLEATAARLEAMGREFIRARSNTALYFFDYDDHVFELDTEDMDAELGD